MAIVGPPCPMVDACAAARPRPVGAEPAAERGLGPRRPALAARGRVEGEASRGGRGRIRPRSTGTLGTPGHPPSALLTGVASLLNEPLVSTTCSAFTSLTGVGSLMATAPADIGRGLANRSAYLLAGLASASAAAAAARALKASTLVFISLLSANACAVTLCMLAIDSRTSALGEVLGAFSAAALSSLLAAPVLSCGCVKDPCVLRDCASRSRSACSFLKSEISSRCSEKSRSILCNGSGGEGCKVGGEKRPRKDQSWNT